jgi:hypothetical protein
MSSIRVVEVGVDDHAGVTDEGGGFGGDDDDGTTVVIVPTPSGVAMSETSELIVPKGYSLKLSERLSRGRGLPKQPHGDRERVSG